MESGGWDHPFFQKHQSAQLRRAESGLLVGRPGAPGCGCTYVYLIPQGGGPLLRNTNYGAGAFSSVSVDTNRLFSDVIVNLRNHDVFVETDDPDIAILKAPTTAHLSARRNRSPARCVIPP